MLLLMVGYLAAVTANLCSWQERGQFGDTIGGFSVVFAALALLGVVYGALLQRQQLQTQREELKIARAQASQAAEQLADQRRERRATTRLVLRAVDPQWIGDRISARLRNVGALPAEDIVVEPTPGTQAVQGAYWQMLQPQEEFLVEFHGTAVPGVMFGVSYTDADRRRRQDVWVLSPDGLNSTAFFE